MPRIIHITDLHLDVYPKNLELALDQIRSETADLILIGGDNGGEIGLRATIECLKLTHPDTAVGWVMGNHDLWRRHYQDLWLSFDHLPGRYLENGNLETEHFTVVGTYGHYDYSAGSPEISQDVYESFTDGRVIWNDRHIERAGRTNPEIAREIADRFKARYATAVERGLPIVVVTHSWPFAPADPSRRSFVGAYLANQLIGDAILETRALPAVLFCGHTHRPDERDDFGFPMINTGSDYKEVRTTVYEV